MNDNLTIEERNLIARIESSGKWDILLYDLSILIPSFIIIGLGIWFNSQVAIIIGMIVYAIFALRSPLYQAKTLPILKSLIRKLNEGQ